MDTKYGRISTDVAAFCVIFWGDLCDVRFSDIADMIEPWWNTLVKNPDFIIRQAVLMVQTEGHSPVMLGVN